MGERFGCSLYKFNFALGEYSCVHTHTQTHMLTFTTNNHECSNCNTDIEIWFHPLEDYRLLGVVNGIIKSDEFCLRLMISDQSNGEGKTYIKVEMTHDQCETTTV